VSDTFKAACDAAGVVDLHFHDLRHHGISLLFERGYQIQQVVLVSGHRDWRHLRRYTNLKPEDLHNI
jgi:site-specific recombinase XerD